MWPTQGSFPSSSLLKAGLVSASGGSSLVAAVGDSITSQAYSVSSTIAAYHAHGFLTWAMSFSKGSLWCPLVWAANAAVVNYNLAVSGKTALQVYNEQIPLLAALNPRPALCSILTGTNNLTINTSQTAVEIANEIVAVAEAVSSLGIIPVVCTILPRGNGTAAGWGALSAGQIGTARGRLMEVNRILRSWAATRPQVILVDWFHTVLNYGSSTSDPQVALLSDYLHPNAPGAIALGQEWWNAVSARVGTSAKAHSGTGDAWSSSDNPYGNMLDPSWSAGGGTAGTGTSGTVPSGWTANRFVGASSTAVLARQARADGTNGNEVTIAMTGADNAQFRIYQGSSGISDSNFTAGDGVYAESDVVFSGTGANQYANPDIEIRMGNPSSFRCWAAHNPSATYGNIQGSFNVRLRTPIVVLPAGGAWSYSFWTVDGIANGGSNTTTRRNCTVRKYNKAALGAVTWP